MTKKRTTATRIVKSKAPRAGLTKARAALSVAVNPAKSVSQRMAAIKKTSVAVCADDKSLDALLGVLRDVKQPIEVRLKALQSLQAASFSVASFEPCRAAHMAALRAVATDPSSEELRRRVLGLLARENDGFAQKKLIEGLKDPKTALGAPEKALQLLSNDVHAEAYPVARAIVERPPNQAAK